MKFSISNCGLTIIYIVWEWTSSLSGSVNRQINREWQRFSLSNMQGKKRSKRIEMIIKLVNEFKLLPAKTRCRSVHTREFTAAQKNCGKSGLGHQASVLPGHWAAGPRAAGPLGRRAAGPPGRWAVAGCGPRPAFSNTSCLIARSFNDQLTLAVNV